MEMETKTFTYTVHYNSGKSHEITFTFTSDNKIYAIVRGIARSGMSRRLSFFMIEDGELINITHVIAQALDYKLDNREWSIRVNGCGMDMIAHALSCFASKLGFKKTPSWVYHYGTI